MERAAKERELFKQGKMKDMNSPSSLGLTATGQMVQGKQGLSFRRARWHVKYSSLSSHGLVKQMMEDCDANKDGKISREEFTELGRRLQLKKCLTKLAL